MSFTTNLRSHLLHGMYVFRLCLSTLQRPACTGLRTVASVCKSQYAALDLALRRTPNSLSLRQCGLLRHHCKMADGKEVESERVTPPETRRELYPPIEPFNHGWLKVSDLHEVYYEQCGNAEGNPIIYLHGGPGGGCSSNSRRFFDPEVYHIILMDQRGAGKSRPNAELEENTTWNLVADLEKLREHLGISKWVVFGGSWGSTLSLSYAETHPDRVKALIVRGIFTLRREELIWLYQEGASYLYPDHWEDFIEPIPKVERGDLMSAYHRRLTGTNTEEKLRCARAWSKWELRTSKLITDQTAVESKLCDDQWLLAFARIENHYFVNGGWFDGPEHLLDGVDKIRHIPGIIIQGRYDLVTPMKTAWDLHKRWPEAEFVIIPDAGHSFSEPGTLTVLLAATEKFKHL